MTDALRLRRLNLLSGLAVRLTSESAGGLLDDTLGLLLMGLAAPAGCAFQVEEEATHWVGERGFQAPEGAREVLAAIAGRVLRTRRAISLHDVRSPLAQLEHAGELTSLGYCALIAVPVVHRREELAVLIALFPQRDVSPTTSGVGVNEEAVDFARAVANILALAIARDRGSQEAARIPAEVQQGGELIAASIAHELRGPVGALSLQLEEQERLVAELADMGGSSDTALGASVSELDELTRDIHAVMDRLRQLVAQLTSGERRDSPLELLDLGEIVRDTLAERRPHLERLGINCETQLGEDCDVVGRRAELRRATLALLEYAAHRCASAGRSLSVSVRVTAAGVALTVGDSGPALSASEQRALASGQVDTGGNLPFRVVQDIVREHGGHLEVRGTPRFPLMLSLLLPCAQSDSGVFPVADSAPIRVARRAEVLVVDDDEVFTRTMRRALKPHNVRSASSASEAEIALLQATFTPDLVLCDIFLPGSNGDELHARVRERRPNVAANFVFVTGGALTPEQVNYLRRSGCPTLHKPIDLDQVRGLLNERCPMDRLASERTPSVRTLSASPSRSKLQTPKRDSQA